MNQESYVINFVYHISENNIQIMIAVLIIYEPKDFLKIEMKHQICLHNFVSQYNLFINRPRLLL